MTTTEIINNSEYSSINEIRENILTEKDLVNIKWKTYINKSWYRKIALALNISIQVVSENRIEKEEYFIYDFTVRATNSLWRYVESSSSCASDEREFNNINHDVRATAQTRSTNRAIADLIWLTEIIKAPGVITHSDQWITSKQKSLLTRLVESKYTDTQTRATLYKQIDWLSKDEANTKIKQLIDEWVEIK